MISDILYFLPFILIFIFFWGVISFVISRMSGWSTLAERYRHSGSFGSFSGKKWHFVSGRMGIMGYNNILFLGADSRGLLVTLPPPFKVVSPNLFIPWDDLYVEGITGLLNNQVLLRFRKSKAVKFKLPVKTVKQIAVEIQKFGVSLKDANSVPFRFEDSIAS